MNNKIQDTFLNSTAALDILPLEFSTVPFALRGLGSKFSWIGPHPWEDPTPMLKIFYCWKVFGILHQELLIHNFMFFCLGFNGKSGGTVSFQGFFVSKIIEVMMHCMVWHKEIRTPGGKPRKVVGPSQSGFLTT